MTQLRDQNQTVSVDTAPSKEPVTLDRFKTQIQYQVDDPSTNKHLNQLIKAARRWAESFLSRALIKQTLLLTLDDFPGDAIIVPRPPLISVASVKFTDTDGSTTTVSSSKYHVNTDDEPGKIVLKDGKDWPSGTPKTTQAVEVTYDAGYGTARSDVPDDIRTAILQRAANYFENRSDITTEGVPRDVPRTTESLLWPHRIQQR